MPKRTRFFESLEERRLLTGSAASTPAAAAATSQLVGDRTVDAALVGPAAATASGGQAASATDSDTADGADSPNEYLSANASQMTGAPLSTATDSAASLAAIDNVYLDPEASGTSPFYSGSSYAPTKTYTTTSTDPVPISPATLAAMAPPIQPLPAKALASEAQPLAASSPAAANVPNVARSGLGGLDVSPDEIIAPAGMAGSSADLPPPGTTAPVAMLPSALAAAFNAAGNSTSAVPNGEAAASAWGGALDASFTQSRWLAGLVSGTASADLPSIERAVDHLCERIERWGEDLFRDAGEWRLSESLVLAVGAAAALEYVRAQFRESGSGPFPQSTREPRQPRLRKSFGRLVESRRRFFGHNRDQT